MSGINKNILGYIGWLDQKNLGDEAMFYVFENIFKNYTIFPYNKIKTFSALENYIRPKSLKACFLGGGTLINSPGFFNHFKEIFYYFPQIPKFTFGCGVQDPIFWDKIEKWDNELESWVKYLKKCEYVSVRGPLSKELLKKTGFNHAEIIGDIALSLSNDKIYKKTKDKNLGFNIGTSYGRVWGNEETILNKSIELIKNLIKQGWNINLFSVWQNDIQYIKQLRDKINSHIKIFHAYKSISETLKFLHTCDVVIGEKLHSVILAHCTHTPAIMLEYRPKCLDYMMSMEMENFNIKTNNIDVLNIIELVNEIYSDTYYYQKKLKAKTDYYKNKQIKTSEHLEKFW